MTNVTGGAETKNGKTWKLDAHVDESGSIPIHTTDLVGFGWLYAFPPVIDEDGIDAFGIVTHDADLNGDGKNDVQDSLQKKNGWHGHNFIFAEGTDNSDFCVAIIVDAPTSGIGIRDHWMKVNVRDSVLAGPLLDTAVGYQITVDGDCDPTVPTADVVDEQILMDLGLPDGLPLGVDVVGLGVGL